MTHFLRALAGAAAIAISCAAAPAFAATMQCAPLQQITTAYPTGATYTADTAGVVQNVDARDVNSLHQASCVQVGVGQNTLCGELLKADLNVGGATTTGDQKMSWFVAPTQYYRLTKITVKNASKDISGGSAAGGVYTAAGKGGVAVVAASQTYAALAFTNATWNLDLTLVSGVGTLGEYLNTPLWFSLTTANGTAATADIFVQCDAGQ